MKMFTLHKTTLLFATLSWVIPFVASMFMVDPVTKEYLPNIIVFKSVMFALLLGVTWFAYSKLQKRDSLKLATANTFLLINIILDSIVLLVALSIPVMVWVTTILPIYLVVFYGTYLVKKNT